MSKRKAPKVRSVTCPHCGKVYQLGYNGTVHGCDSCNNTTRRGNGTIINLYGKGES